MARPKIPKRSTRWIAAAWRALLRPAGSAALRSQFAAMKDETVSLASRSDRLDSDDPLAAKFQELHHSFEGSSELCYFHAKTIVQIRRGIWLKNNLDIFFSMWAEEPEHLCEKLNSRWLLSALDTYADHGTPIERPTALMIVTFFNAIRLAESERFGEADLPAAGKGLPQPRQPLWDGIETYNFEKGDMLRNMIERMRHVVAEQRSLSMIMETMFSRAMHSDNVLSRSVQANVKIDTLK
jgi:hypothetical protein